MDRPSFWEIFAGQAVLTRAFRNRGVCCATPLDAVTKPEFNLLDAGFLTVVLGILGTHLIDLAHVAPPCSTISVALNGFEHSRVRSIEYPGGLPDLTAEKAQKVRVGNALAEIAAAIMGAQHSAGNLLELEQPGKSLMPRYEPVRKIPEKTGSVGYQRDACVDGASGESHWSSIPLRIKRDGRLLQNVRDARRTFRSAARTPPVPIGRRWQSRIGRRWQMQSEKDGNRR